MCVLKLPKKVMIVIVTLLSTISRLKPKALRDSIKTDTKETNVMRDSLCHEFCMVHCCFYEPLQITELLDSKKRDRKTDCFLRDSLAHFCLVALDQILE